MVGFARSAKLRNLHCIPNSASLAKLVSGALFGAFVLNSHLKLTSKVKRNRLSIEKARKGPQCLHCDRVENISTELMMESYRSSR